MNEIKTSIIRIIPGITFEETMKLVTQDHIELRAKGIFGTYEYELDKVYYPVHQLYDKLVEHAFAEAIAEIQSMDIKPRCVTATHTPKYFKLIMLLREFHHNCMAVYYRAQRKECERRDAREAIRLREFQPPKLVQ